MNLSDIDVLILCGGQGSRLRGVLPERTPKAMAEIDGRPFLDHLTSYLFSTGFEKFILCLGYQPELIERYFADQPRFEFSRENDGPLGTGGAIANALPIIGSDFFFVINGDTYCQLDFADILKNHLESGFDVTVPYDNQYRHIGTYLLSKKAIRAAVEELGPKFGLEAAFAIFPKKKILVNWYPTDVEFHDIGTPESLENFRRFWREKKIGNANCKDSR